MVEVGGMQQFFRLLAHRLTDGRMGVPEIAHGDTAYCIEIAVSLGIPQPGALSSFEGDR